MERNTQRSRTLAIDLRAQRFGYAIFEGPKRLLDYGTSAYPQGGDPGAIVAGRRVANLIRLFHPSEVVIRKDHRGNAHNGPGAGAILKSVRREARLRSVPLGLVGSDEINAIFQRFHVATKYDMASMLAGMFPELVWKLPARRRIWESERRVMIIFDAVLLGWTHLNRNAIMNVSHK